MKRQIPYKKYDGLSKQTILNDVILGLIIN